MVQIEELHVFFDSAHEEILNQRSSNQSVKELSWVPVSRRFDDPWLKRSKSLRREALTEFLDMAPACTRPSNAIAGFESFEPEL